MVDSAVNVTASGFKVIQERAFQFAKENADVGFTLASELAKAKDLQDILRLQSNLSRHRCSPPRQAQELGGLMAEACAAASQKAERPNSS